MSRPVTIGLVAQRITRLTTDQKIAGSNPAVLELTLFTTMIILNLYVKVVGDIFIYILEVTCSISDHCHMLYYSGQR